MVPQVVAGFKERHSLMYLAFCCGRQTHVGSQRSISHDAELEGVEQGQARALPLCSCVAATLAISIVLEA